MGITGLLCYKRSVIKYKSTCRITVLVKYLMNFVLLSWVATVISTCVYWMELHFQSNYFGWLKPAYLFRIRKRMQKTQVENDCHNSALDWLFCWHCIATKNKFNVENENSKLNVATQQGSFLLFRKKLCSEGRECKSGRIATESLSSAANMSQHSDLFFTVKWL